MSVISRRISVQDIESVFKLEQQIFNNANKEQIERSLTSISSIYYVIEVDGIIVGFASVIVCSPEAEIVNIAIDALYRGNGYSTKLLKTIFCDLPEVNQMFLEVRESNLAAINLYKSNGFTIVGRRTDYYSDNEDALVMKNVTL